MATDEELIVRIRQSDIEAFDQLYGRYQRRLFSYILRMVLDRHSAEDIFQEVFLKVLKDKRFEPKAGRFGGFLFTVARNQCLNHLRNAGRREQRMKELECEPVHATATPDPEKMASAKEQVETLTEAINALPPSSRETFILKQIGDCTYSEIAHIQGVPEGTVKSRVHLAVKAVQVYLVGDRAGGKGGEG